MENEKEEGDGEVLCDENMVNDEDEVGSVFCVCVGGWRRCGMKDSTRCSVTAGARLAHHCEKPSLYPRGK